MARILSKKVALYILEQNESASMEDVKKSYRRLSKMYHPDKHFDSAAAEEIFKLVTEAYNSIVKPNGSISDKYDNDAKTRIVRLKALLAEEKNKANALKAKQMREERERRQREEFEKLPAAEKIRLEEQARSEKIKRSKRAARRYSKTAIKHSFRTAGEYGMFTLLYLDTLRRVLGMFIKYSAKGVAMSIDEQMKENAYNRAKKAFENPEKSEERHKYKSAMDKAKVKLQKTVAENASATKAYREDVAKKTNAYKERGKKAMGFKKRAKRNKKIAGTFLSKAAGLYVAAEKNRLYLTKKRLGRKVSDMAEKMAQERR